MLARLSVVRDREAWKQVLREDILSYASEERSSGRLSPLRLAGARAIPRKDGGEDDGDGFMACCGFELAVQQVLRCVSNATRGAAHTSVYRAPPPRPRRGLESAGVRAGERGANGRRGRRPGRASEPRPEATVHDPRDALHRQASEPPLRETSSRPLVHHDSGSDRDRQRVIHPEIRVSHYVVGTPRAPTPRGRSAHFQRGKPRPSGTLPPRTGSYARLLLEGARQGAPFSSRKAFSSGKRRIRLYFSIPIEAFS